MSTKRFVIKTVVMLLIFAIISTVVLTFLNSGILTNEIALGQMKNDNTEYLIWQEYQALIPIIYAVYSLITLGIIGKVSYDTYIFIKIKKLKKQEKETNEKN